MGFYIGDEKANSGRLPFASVGAIAAVIMIVSEVKKKPEKICEDANVFLLKSSSDNRNIQQVVARIKKPSTLSSSPPCAMSQSIIVILIPFSTLNRYFLSGYR